MVETLLTMTRSLAAEIRGGQILHDRTALTLPGLEESRQRSTRSIRNLKRKCSEMDDSHENTLVAPTRSKYSSKSGTATAQLLLHEAPAADAIAVCDNKSEHHQASAVRSPEKVSMILHQRCRCRRDRGPNHQTAQFLTRWFGALNVSILDPGNTRESFDCLIHRPAHLEVRYHFPS